MHFIVYNDTAVFMTAGWFWCHIKRKTNIIDDFIWYFAEMPSALTWMRMIAPMQKLERGAVIDVLLSPLHLLHLLVRCQLWSHGFKFCLPTPVNWRFDFAKINEFKLSNHFVSLQLWFGSLNPFGNKVCTDVFYILEAWIFGMFMNCRAVL